MEDERWTVKDKIEQFQGLSTLYNNSNDNNKEQVSAQRKKQNNEIKNLATQNQKFRQQYEELLHGDKKTLLPVLNAHPTMQLALKNLNPQQIEEELKQTIFCKNKELDRLRYKRKNLEEILLNKKLEYNILQERVEDGPENYLWEQEIENQLQSISVKLNTARAHRNVYEKALDTLQKDAIRFVEVLEELKKDLEQQSESILRAVEMGQNMVEQLSHLQKEYRATERAVRFNMKQRNQALRNLRTEIDNIRQQGQAVHRESHAVILPPQSIANLETDSDVDVQAMLTLHLQHEISMTEDILKQIKEAAMVQQIQDICPRIEKQRKQKAWLQSQVDQNRAQMDKMLELHNQLDILLEVTMYHTLTDEAIKHREERIQLSKDIVEEKQIMEDIEAELIRLGKKIVYIRTALLTLNMMIDSVIPVSDGPEQGVTVILDTGFESQTVSGLSQPNTDALTLMKQVTSKVKGLLERVATAKRAAKLKLPTHSPKVVESTVHFVFEDEADNIVSDMLNELDDLDDPSVMTRKAIKAESKQLVELYDNPRAMFQDDTGPKYKKHKCF